MTARVTTISEGTYAMRDKGAKGMKMDNGLTAVLAIGSIRVAKDGGLVGGSIHDSTIAAANKIGSLVLDGDLVNTRIFAGAILGDDGVLGGTDSDSDVFNRGSIGSVRIAGAFTGSIASSGTSSGRR